MITSQVIQRIVDDSLVVADLTERNPNVFYELAIRHAIRKPLVQIIKKGEQIPFDVAGTRTIHVDHHDLDSVESAKNEIIDKIRSLEKNPSNLETPISVSLDLQMLRQSENPEQRSLVDILSMMSDIHGSVHALEKRLDITQETRFRHLLMQSEERLSRNEKVIQKARSILQDTLSFATSEPTLTDDTKTVFEDNFMELNDLLRAVSRG